MRSIPQALIWETAVRSWWSIPVFFLSANFLPVIVYSVLGKDFLDSSEPILLGLKLGFYGFAGFLLGVGTIWSQGQTSRLYGYPISTASVVGWQMLIGGALLATQMAASCWMLNTFFHAHWPTLLFTVTAVAVLCSLQLAASVSHRSFLGFCAISSPFLPLALWFVIRYRQDSSLWDQVMVWDWLILIATIVIAYPFSVAGVSSDRCSEAWFSKSILVWLINRWSDSELWVKKDHRPFRSSDSALAWQEWQTKGLATPLVYLILVCFFASIWLLDFILHPQHPASGSLELREILRIFGWVLTGVATTCGVTLGLSVVSGTRDRAFTKLINDTPVFSMGNFQATRPVTCSAMAKSVLRTGAIGIAITWGMWGLVVVSVMIAYWKAEVAWSFILPPHVRAWFIPLTLLMPWLGMANVATMGLSGRFVYFLFPSIAVPILYVLGMEQVQNWLGETTAANLHQGVLSVLSVGIIVATILAFRIATLRKIVSRHLALVCTVIALLIAVLGIATCPLSVTLVISLLITAFACLVVLPFATAPLAIAWNRHR